MKNRRNDVPFHFSPIKTLLFSTNKTIDSSKPIESLVMSWPTGHQQYIENNACIRVKNRYFGVYFPSCEATREINTKITLEWAQKRFVTRVHTLFYFLHDITNPYMTTKRRALHIVSVPYLLDFRCAGDVIIDCWWHHNDQTIDMRSRG